MGNRKRETETEYLDDMQSRINSMQSQYPSLKIEKDGLMFKITNKNTNESCTSNRMNLASKCAQLK